MIDVTLDLTEKDGVVSGTINSSHGNFPVSSGSRKGKTVTLQFDADGTSGTISLEASEEKLVGTWSAGDDGGPVDVKKVAAEKEGGTKESRSQISLLSCYSPTLSRARATAPHTANLASKKSSTRDRTSGALFDS